MVTLMKRRRGGERAKPAVPPPSEAPTQPDTVRIDLAPGDPLLALLQEAAAPVDLDQVDIESPGLEMLREAGMKIVVPLITQGELIGTLNLGPRLSEQDYSRDDLRLLDSLASQAAPAVRVAQLLEQQDREARERERVANELRVARLIQHHFLPQSLPGLDGWDVAVSYQPAREVGGDFYDFIELPGGRLGIVVADVTDKGVPAAMVMSATRTLLRATSQRLVEPGEVLARVNDVLVDTIPPNMFITCLYGVLDPADGAFRFANAGHNLPCVAGEHGATEIRARGMPLGMMPGMDYEENLAVLGVGNTLLLYSDGIVEAHNEMREMFGFERMLHCLDGHGSADETIDGLLQELAKFTGLDWEQEDDVTVVCLRRTAHAVDTEETLLSFSVSPGPSYERLAMDRVAAAVLHLGLSDMRLERLKTAVAEGTMNAVEHGNGNDPALAATVTVRASARRIVVSITDRARRTVPPVAPVPDLDAKLAGGQEARGWGLFLIRNMVDDVSSHVGPEGHTLELVMYREDTQ